MKLDIQVTEIPTGSTGTKAPNPYAEQIKTLSESMRTEDQDGKAMTFTVPRAKGTDDKTFAKAVQKIVNKWQEGGEDFNVTIRALIERDDEKVPTGTVTVWAIPRITRERKPKDAASAA